MDSLGIDVRLIPAQSELLRAPHSSVECDFKLVEESLGIIRVDHPSQILFFLFRKEPDTAIVFLLCADQTAGIALDPSVADGLAVDHAERRPVTIECRRTGVAGFEKDREFLLCQGRCRAVAKLLDQKADL